MADPHTIDHARRALRQHDPHPVDGRGPEGQLRPSRDADGARAARLRALHAGDEPLAEPTRTGPTATASCSPAGTRRCSCTRSLYLTGYGLTLDDLKNFRQLGSPTAGHPEYGHAPGIETTTGPLGQGISNAVGMALAERMLAARFNRPGHEIVDHYTYVDRLRRRPAGGRRLRGLARSPATSASAADRLLRRQPHLDRGRHRARLHRGRRPRATRPTAGTSRTSARTSGSTASRRRWPTPARSTDRPSLIIVRTHIAPGSPNKQDTHGAHGTPLGDEEIKLTKEVYGWPSQEPFFVPDEALRALPRVGRARRGARRPSGSERFERLPREHPEEARRVRAASRPRACPRAGTPTCPEGPGRGHDRHPQGLARRIQWVAAQVPELVGGSADLAPSTLTLINGGGNVEQPAPTAAATSTSASASTAWARSSTASCLHGLRAFGAGFLIFSDYMKGVDPARRGHAASRRPSCSRTTRSASARTARRTSRSSSSRTCARRRTSTSCAPRASTRPRSPGSSR